jgi:hypothetical protein
MGVRGLDSSGVGCEPVASFCEYGNERTRLSLDYLKT